MCVGCTQTHFHPPPFLAHLLFYYSESYELTLAAYQILQFTFFFPLTLLSAENVIRIFIPHRVQVSVSEFFTPYNHSGVCCHLRSKGRRSCPRLLCMRSISIDPLFYVESAVNTRRVAEIVLFMNTLPKETSITSGYSRPSEGTDGGRECYTEFTAFYHVPI